MQAGVIFLEQAEGGFVILTNPPYEAESRLQDLLARYPYWPMARISPRSTPHPSPENDPSASESDRASGQLEGRAAGVVGRAGGCAKSSPVTRSGSRLGNRRSIGRHRPAQRCCT